MEPRDRGRLVLLLVEAGLTVAVTWITARGRAPMRPWFWHQVMRASQAGAYRLGTLGMRAEVRYRNEVGGP